MNHLQLRELRRQLRLRNRQHHRRLLVERLEDRWLLTTLVWEGDVSANWNDNVLGNSNWHIQGSATQATPSDGDTLVFDGTGSNRNSMNNDTTAGNTYTLQQTGTQPHRLQFGNDITLVAGVAISNTASVLNALRIDVDLETNGSEVDATQNVVLNGDISGSGGLTISGTVGAGLNGNNTFSGDVTITGSTLFASGGSAIPDTATVDVQSGSRFNLTGSETIKALKGSGDVDGSGTLTIGANGGGDTFSGLIEDFLPGFGQVLSLTKIGSGTQILSGANTYSQPTNVTGGGLSVTGSLSNSSTVTVSNDATLSGDGPVGPVNLEDTATLSPGTSTDIFEAGDVNFDAGTTLDIEINGATTPGTNYDQLDSTGNVTIDVLATLATSSLGGFIPNAGDEFEIINRGGGSGNFLGLPEGATISNNFLGSGLEATVTYAGDDGNDVVIELGTDIVITGTGNDDVLEVIATGADSGTWELNSGGAVSFSGITSFTFNAGDGNDEMIIDHSGGVFQPSGGIFYNGQGAGGDSDELTLTGGTIADIEFNYTSLNDGNIDYTGGPSPDISYTGLEPIAMTGTVTDITLNYPGASETITVSSGGAGQTTVDSTAGETTTFTNPTGSLTIDPGGGVNTINVGGLGSGFDADVTIDGACADTVNFTGNTGLGTGDLEVDAGIINVEAGVAISTAASGVVEMTACRNIFMDAGSSISTANGNVTLEANLGASAVPGDFNGIELDDADITTTGGSISATGTGGTAGTGIQRGVVLNNGSLMQAGGAGTVTVVGTGGLGTGAGNHGVALVNSSTITSSGGNVAIIGTGSGTGGGASGRGVALTSASEISAGGSGTVTVTGTGAASAGGSPNQGVFVLGVGTKITSNGGNVTVMGTAGGTSGSFNIGVDLAGGEISVGGSATVSVTGTGAATSGNDNHGVVLRSGGEIKSLANGDVIVEGTGGGTGGSSGNEGVVVAESGSQILAAGTGRVAGLRHGRLRHGRV